MRTILLSLILLTHPVTTLAAKRQTVGWIEEVMLNPGNLSVHAKLDTGADNSALHAIDTAEFEKDGIKYLRFTVSDRQGRKTELERRLIRYSYVKRRGKLAEKRPVVRMGICLGTHYVEADVGLVDRSNFKYQMLLGRVVFAGSVVIDPALTYVTEPDCGKRS